jgi:guanylate kinase
MRASGKVVVVTGPSGVGKSTIVKEVIRRTGAVFSVSATTRPPRPGERDGVDYSFVTPERFERMARDGELLEWAQVHGNSYGTPAAPVEAAVAAGRTVVLDIDVQGGLQVHRRMSDATFVLIVPPDEPSLARRLRGRATDDEATIARRLAKAADELRLAQQSGVYTHTVVNDELEKAIDQVAAIVSGRGQPS